ncbi:MAG: hypothetical protein HYY16_12630 [Planctomycetes bacterium]|nr:hypothetical protein [Planctomycetota bacterium]
MGWSPSDVYLKDEEPGALASHQAAFDSAMEVVEKEMQGDAKQGVPYWIGRYLFKAIRIASWSLHEDFRISARKFILEAEQLRKATVEAGAKLVDANTKGAGQLVERMAELKASSDNSSGKMIKLQWGMTIATWVIALANAALTCYVIVSGK